MKKKLSMILSFLMLTGFTTGCSAQPQDAARTSGTTIILKIGSPVMSVNGRQQEIDSGRGTAPVIEDGRTLLPVRAVVEAMGGMVTWEEDTQTAILAKGGTVIRLTIGSTVAFLNGEQQTLDTKPIVLGDRTMLPVRFIAEHFGYEVTWDGETQTVTLTSNETDSGGSNMPVEPDDGTSKSMVVYFSQTGNTRSLAQRIAEVTGAGLYEIVPEIPYTAGDLDYGNQNSRANKEQNDDSARPAIAGEAIDFSQYDTIYLGFPIWWGTIPRIVNTFMDSYDLSGKTIMPFCTSGGSGIASAVSAIRQYCPDADVKDGLRGSSQTNEAEIGQWLSENGQIRNERTENKVSLNLETKSVTLNSGYEMPIVGIGTYSLLDDICVNSVSTALQNGYRLIDTASIYNNEESVGEGIQKSGVPREEIFVTTKLYMNQYSDAENAIDEALRRLDVDYIDLMLLHHPGAGDVEAYRAMEQAVREGKLRSIGLSNYYVKELEEFLPQITITPALVQNEIHPYYQENEVIGYMHEKGIVIEAWYPFGGRGHTAELFNNETIVEIAKAHNKSPAQVILRWDLQKGVVVIPGSSNPDHIKENMELFDFELTAGEMESINALDRNEKHDWY